MNIRHPLTLLLTFCLGFSLNANTVCQAPAPSFAQIIDQANESATVTWSEVPNALSYQVETTKTSTGELVASDIVTGTTYSRTNLNPGESYSFNIRASYCEFGPFGEGLGIDFQTEVIVVDVILQMECPDGNSEEENHDIGDISTLELIAGGCYMMTIKTLSTNPQIEIDLAITQLGNGNGPVLIGDFTYNPNNFAMYGNGPLIGMMDLDNGNLPLFNMTSGNTQGDTYLNILWLQDVEVTLTRCTDCELIRGHGIQPLEMDVANENEIPTSIHLAPNPVQSILHLALPTEGQIEVWDMTGRRWARLGKENPQLHFDLDVRNWPAGTYVVRWHSPDNPPVVQYFLKHKM